jgi:peptidoglycan/xylan/chitin deacetylase (PgdA/CDA1 family)
MVRVTGTILAYGAALLLSTPSFAAGSDCAGNPDALGTSRKITVNSESYPKIGKAQYRETLPLRAREVVLTFNGGPEPPYTDRILDILARECVKATFFVLGSNTQEAADLVRRAFNEGHAIGSFGFSEEELTSMPLEAAKSDIENGIIATTQALENVGYLSPYFRAPSLALTTQLERHIISIGLMIWSIDADSGDWSDDLTEEQLVRQTVDRLEEVGGGVLQMHDRPVTARALQSLLTEFKRRDFRMVQLIRLPYLLPKNYWIPGSRPLWGLDPE